tara:strand:+ start:2720 stop:3565 length:846 start_codon:yes stop_codon:yes gene_type:complete
MPLIIETNDLVNLLQQTERKATIAGQTGPQVYGVKLTPSEDQGLSTTWIVKDGISSVSHFAVPLHDDNDSMEPIFIPDITRVLGILKYHGGKMKITATDEKVVFKSNNKQTTIQSTPRALAFPNSRDSLLSWAEKSEMLAAKINNVPIDNPTYVTAEGELYPPMLRIQVDAVDLFEAFRCAGINNQDPDVFVFNVDDNGNLKIRVGNDLKGATESSIAIDSFVGNGGFECAYNGGFNEIFKYVNGPVWLSFFDFRSKNQGIGLLMAWDRSYVLQASFEQGR